MDTDKQQTDKIEAMATLPATARHSLNRCNLPAVILGGLTFQRHPTPLSIDGVLELHAALFNELEQIASAAERAQHFIDTMSVQFRLHALDEAGFDETQRVDRSRANYQRLLRGWAFNPDGKEGAVLKGWVESRFGLVPRFHEGAIHSTQDESYRRYQHDYAEGLYNTNALEAQLDLLYSYCQYELHRDKRRNSHCTLYRGMNAVERLQLDGLCGEHQQPLLLNNINSFSMEMERADEFGDHVIEVAVPREKIAFFSELLPDCLRGEGEVIVLGGVYCAKMLC
jgi:NAD+--dinitrogen-reductase ADP-D-ribosyltransferase